MARGRRKKRLVIPYSSIPLSESKPLPPSSPISCPIYLARTQFSDSPQYFGFIFDPAAEAAHDDGGRFMPTNLCFRIDGEERFRAVTSAYYHGAVVVLIVYDISRNTTFESVKRWLDKLNNLLSQLR